MKRRFLKAFTLIELIVSMALISVIILGVFAITNVLSNNGQDFGQRYLVRSETQTTLNHILNDAALAVGSGTPVGIPPVFDQGIETYTVGLNTVICIHQQLPSLVTGANPLGDTWVCYTFDQTPTDAAYEQIYYCSPGSVPYNLDDINDLTGNYRGNNQGNCGGVGTANEIFLGTAYSISAAPPAPPTQFFTNTATSALSPWASPPMPLPIPGQMVFSIQIENCLSDINSATSPPSLSLTCNQGGPGVSSDPVNNPEVTVSGSVIPQGEGFNQT